MTIEAHGADATGALLQSGAIMLGAALVFVTLFRKLDTVNVEDLDSLKG